MTDPIRAALEQIAADLGPLRDEVVFVGGATVGLLVTDPAAAPVRPTNDIDVIFEVSTRSEYDHRTREALLARGFKELFGENIPTCAWQKREIRLDIIPTDEELLGFSNRGMRRPSNMPNGSRSPSIGYVWFQAPISWLQDWLVQARSIASNRSLNR